ncbi:MAG: hypothetical protein IPP69_13565 [Flavobacteriales bacterium]|nr:hypothetical protein [Flavobacteriales bacterium]
MAFSGVLLIKGFDERVSIGWLSVGVLAAVIAGFAYNSIIKCKKTDHAYTIVIHLTLVSIPVTGVWCFFDFVMPLGWDWLLIVIMGISTNRTILLLKALMSGNAADITPWNYTGAIFAVFSGYLFFGESIGLLALVGMAVIAVALILNSKLQN